MATVDSYDSPLNQLNMHANFFLEIKSKENSYKDYRYYYMYNFDCQELEII